MDSFFELIPCIFFVKIFTSTLSLPFQPVWSSLSTGHANSEAFWPSSFLRNQQKNVNGPLSHLFIDSQLYVAKSHPLGIGQLTANCCPKKCYDSVYKLQCLCKDVLPYCLYFLKVLLLPLKKVQSEIYQLQKYALHESDETGVFANVWINNVQISKM